MTKTRSDGVCGKKIQILRHLIVFDFKNILIVSFRNKKLHQLINTGN